MFWLSISTTIRYEYRFTKRVKWGIRTRLSEIDGQIKINIQDLHSCVVQKDK